MFVDIYDEISKELKIIDYIKIKNTFKKALKYGIEGYVTNIIEREEFVFSIKKVLKGKKAYKQDT